MKKPYLCTNGHDKNVVGMRRCGGGLTCSECARISARKYYKENWLKLKIKRSK